MQVNTLIASLNVNVPRTTISSKYLIGDQIIHSPGILDSIIIRNLILLYKLMNCTKVLYRKVALRYHL